MEDKHLLPVVRELLIEIGFNKKDISALEDSKCLNKNNKIDKSENSSKFYVQPDQNSPTVRFQSSNVRALNLSPRFTPSGKAQKSLPPPTKKLNGRIVRKVKDDQLYSAASNLASGNVAIKTYKKITKVFGSAIDDLPSICTCLRDGQVVSIPEIIYQLSNIILKDISMEGLFRKAGSTQRQNNVKDIIDNGQKLPDFLHAIDAACLLKLFVRSLPTPLLSSGVLLVMSKCLSLPAEKTEDGFLLTFLAVPRSQRHTLLYIFEVLHIVSDPDNDNRMNANSLSIVLGPNFLSTISMRQKKIWSFSANGKDNVLSSTLLIIEQLIKMGDKLGKIPLILDKKLKTIYSAESMENIASNSPKKKRRSGSLHRLLTGLRKAVQGPSSGETSFEPLFNSFKPKKKRRSSDRCGNSSESDAEAVATTPKLFAKRKLAVLDDGLNNKCNEVSTPNPCIKRPRLSLEGLGAPVLPPRRAATGHSSGNVQFNTFVHSVQPKIMQIAKRDLSVHRRYSLRDRVLTSNSSNPKRTLAMTEKQFTARRQSLRLAGVSPVICLRVRRSPTIASVYNLRERKNSPNIKDDMNHSERKERNHLSPNAGNNLTKQGKRTCQIQPMVRSPWESIDKSCINSGTPHRTDIVPRCTSATSHVDLVQSTYEAVKLESKNFDASPCQSLSLGLSKELKARSRRSSEYKVQRSPSERRISKIRRLSKENTPRQTPTRNGEESPCSLRRGKPNTLTSGLPLLARPLNAIDFKDCDKHLKFRASSVSVLANTSSEAFTPKDLSTSDIQSPELPSSGKQKEIKLLDNSSVNVVSLDNNLISRVEKSSLEEGKSCFPSLAMSVSSDSDDNLQWVPAKDAILDNRDFQTPMKPLLDVTHHRMSIDALNKQKKVTANRKIFNGQENAPKLLHRTAHTPTIKSTSVNAPGHSVLRTSRARMAPLMSNNCFHGESGFTPLPPKPYRPKRLLDDKTRSATKSTTGYPRK